MTPTLDGFCKYIAAERVLNHHDTAWAFKSFFHLFYSPTMDELRELLRRAGVGSTSDIPLPKGLRGFHFSLDEALPVIIYDENDGLEEQKHTLLHEIYEIIREMLGYPQVDPFKDGTVCCEANRFAGLVLISMYVFDGLAESRIPLPTPSRNACSRIRANRVRPPLLRYRGRANH